MLAAIAALAVAMLAGCRDATGTAAARRLTRERQAKIALHKGR